MSTTLPYLLNPSELTITIDGRPHKIPSNDPRYAKMVQLIKDASNADAAIRNALDNIGKLKAYVLGTDIEIRSNQLYYKGEQVTGAFGNRLLWMIQEKVDIGPWIAFLERLHQNPAFAVVTRLYEFMEHGKMTVTPDGYVLAYKRVNKKDGKLVDVRTGKLDNSVGTVLAMHHRHVDDNINNTCSYGLHVCSYDYLTHYSGDVVVMVKLDPADVVAIPTDYNNTKMRVCKYEVVAIIPPEELKTKPLSRSPVTETPKPAKPERAATVGEVDAPAPTRWEVHVGTCAKDIPVSKGWGFQQSLGAVVSRSAARHVVDYGPKNPTWVGIVDAIKRNSAKNYDVVLRVYDAANKRYL